MYSHGCWQVESEVQSLSSLDELLLPVGIADYTFVKEDAGGLLGKGKFSAVWVARKGEKEVSLPIDTILAVLTDGIAGRYQAYALIQTSSSHRFTTATRTDNTGPASSSSQPHQSVRDDSHTRPFLPCRRVLSQLYQLGRLCRSAMSSRQTVRIASLYGAISTRRRRPISSSSSNLHRTQRHQARKYPHPPQNSSYPHSRLWPRYTFQCKRTEIDHLLRQSCFPLSRAMAQSQEPSW